MLSKSRKYIKTLNYGIKQEKSRKYHVTNTTKLYQEPTLWGKKKKKSFQIFWVSRLRRKLQIKYTARIVKNNTWSLKAKADMEGRNFTVLYGD